MEGQTGRRERHDGSAEQELAKPGAEGAAEIDEEDKRAGAEWRLAHGRRQGDRNAEKKAGGKEGRW